VGKPAGRVKAIERFQEAAMACIPKPAWPSCSAAKARRNNLRITGESRNQITANPTKSPLGRIDLSDIFGPDPIEAPFW
jgi:hypothetical protein